MSDSTNVPPPPASDMPPGRVSRLGLFLPIAFLVVLLAGWSAFWFVARARVHDAITIWLAQEAEQQRHWTCPDRTLGGFPFRFEVRCTDLRFTGVTPAGTVSGTLARFLAVAQVYKPNHVIVEAEGPLVVDQERGERLTLNWQAFDASVVFTGNRLDRFSVVVEAPVVGTGRSDGSVDAVEVLRAASWQSHLRVDPERPADDHVYDVAFTLTDARVPALDAVIGNTEPATFAFKGAITEAAPFTAKAPSVELERWRLAGGVLEIDDLSAVKGAQRLQARGQFSLDDLHRPQGRLEASMAGLEQLLARFGVGGRGNMIIGGLSILGGARAAETPPGLTALPPVVLRGGQVLVGPLRIGTVEPLY